MSALFEKLNDGGPFFSYPLFILLFLVIALAVRAFLSDTPGEKSINLLKHLGWFAVAWGFLGRTFGLIKAFDMVAAQGELTPRLMADGLKMAILNPLFGISVFILARIGIILLVLLKKNPTLIED